MKKTKDKTLSIKSKIIILAIIIIIAIIGILINIFMKNNSKTLNLSEFEKIAVYGYLEDYLSLDKLYLLSGKSDYDELHYTQSKIKNILDSYYTLTKEETISTSIINTELDKQYGISSESIDYHGIVVSDYEFSPSEQAFKRVEGANSNMNSLEMQVDTVSNNDSKISIKNIEKVSNESYIVYFDIIDSENTVHESGNIVIKLIDNSYSLESCTIN